VQRLRVRVLGGSDAEIVFTPDDGSAVTLGSTPGNSVVLDDPLISRYHLELRRTAEGIAVEDLRSRNGTFIGDIRIERVVVPAGTRLRAGGRTIVIEDADEVELPPTDPAAALPELIGRSDALLEVSRLVRRLAAVGSSVLIEGETGVGKEAVARAIHDHGARRDAPFVVVDCGSMPANLIESQLLGHEKGAFTGAEGRRVGAFERAHGGTVLLDEIGELPLELQPALLGVLERRRFCRVGGSEELGVDVRVLAATHRDLRAAVNEGRFRADLYFRLAVARIVVPPLRERPDDVEPLVQHFVERITGIPGENPLASAIPALKRHVWTGNVRELRNVVEAALIFGQLRLEDGRALELPGSATASPLLPYREARARALADFELAYLSQAISECRGNASEAARRAKMDRPYLLTLLRKHGLR
jgi:DNA-binding NtrC family response regulator